MLHEEGRLRERERLEKKVNEEKKEWVMPSVRILKNRGITLFADGDGTLTNDVVTVDSWMVRPNPPLKKGTLYRVEIGAQQKDDCLCTSINPAGMGATFNFGVSHR